MKCIKGNALICPAVLSQCGESVLTALGGCKILRELSKQGIETEAKLSMKDLAQKFENMAHGMMGENIRFLASYKRSSDKTLCFLPWHLLTDVFSLCYQTKASDSYKLLIRKSTMWGNATCLKMAMAADARIFFSHDGVQVF